MKNVLPSLCETNALLDLGRTDRASLLFNYSDPHRSLFVEIRGGTFRQIKKWLRRQPLDKDLFNDLEFVANNFTHCHYEGEFLVLVEHDDVGILTAFK